MSRKKIKRMDYNVGRTAYLTFIQKSPAAKLLDAAYQQAAIRQVLYSGGYSMGNFKSSVFCGLYWSTLNSFETSLLPVKSGRKLSVFALPQIHIYTYQYQLYQNLKL